MELGTQRQEFASSLRRGRALAQAAEPLSSGSLLNKKIFRSTCILGIIYKRAPKLPDSRALSSEPLSPALSVPVCLYVTSRARSVHSGYNPCATAPGMSSAPPVLSDRSDKATARDCESVYAGAEKFDSPHVPDSEPEENAVNTLYISNVSIGIYQSRGTDHLFSLKVIVIVLLWAVWGSLFQMSKETLKSFSGRNSSQN